MLEVERHLTPEQYLVPLLDVEVLVCRKVLVSMAYGGWLCSPLPTWVMQDNF